jgi:hypothetical protein
MGGKEEGGDYRGGYYYGGEYIVYFIDVVRIMYEDYV